MAGSAARAGLNLVPARIEKPSQEPCLVKILPELSPNEGFQIVTIGQQFLATFSYFHLAPLLGAAKPC
jgi:hypothetical protein